MLLPLRFLEKGENAILSLSSLSFEAAHLRKRPTPSPFFPFLSISPSPPSFHREYLLVDGIEEPQREWCAPRPDEERVCQ